MTMRTVTLGNSDLASSRLGFGTSSLHHLLSSSARQRLLHHAWELGIRHFDTAPLYGHEQAERELGRFGRGKRADMILATKFGILPIPLLTKAPAVMYARMYGMGLARKLIGNVPSMGDIVRDFSPRHAVERVERSLRLLRTDYLDIVFLHEPTLAQVKAPDELLKTLSDLQAHGKVRHFGLSTTGTDCAEIGKAHPALATMLQVDADPATGGLAAVEKAGLRTVISFGHMRGMKNPPASPAERMREGLRQATQGNPDGVILFSSRKPGHIEEAVRHLETLETS
jgi:aryl-alcohol dehydrogenase-like predicted oxidoreductase